MTKLYAVQVLNDKRKWEHLWFDKDDKPITYEDKELAERDLAEFLGNLRDSFEEDEIPWRLDKSRIAVREVGEISRPGDFHKSGSEKIDIRERKIKSSL